MMGIFERLFRRQRAPIADQTQGTTSANAKVKALKWEVLDGYVPQVQGQVKEVAIVTAAIAAGEASASSFQVKQIMKRNPEVVFVSLVAAALAAEVYPESRFRITAIKKKIRRS
ncbi:hypothetical protein ACSFB8_05595 [Enterococcus faecalis]